MKKIADYFSNVKKEFFKIKFIEKKELYIGTVSTLIMIFVLGLIFSLFDLIIRFAVLAIIGV